MQNSHHFPNVYFQVTFSLSLPWPSLLLDPPSMASTNATATKTTTPQIKNLIGKLPHCRFEKTTLTFYILFYSAHTVQLYRTL